MPFTVIGRDLEIVVSSEMLATERQIYNIAYKWNLKTVQMNSFTDQK